MTRTTRQAGPGRGGVAVLLVMVLLSVALATSYALMRSQGTTLLLRSNSGLRLSARRAALSGMAIARRAIHQADWAGVETPLTGTLGPHQGYQITFSTGDPALTPEHPEYADYPYRLTVSATGWSADPAAPERVSRHQIQAVFRLVPRALADEPFGWDTLLQSTLLQSQPKKTRLEVPCRIEGRVRLQGRLELAEDLRWSDRARRQYLVDLNRMRTSEPTDCRPFTGPVELPYRAQKAGLTDLLHSGMQVPVADAAPVALPFQAPGFLDSYRLYPGGRTYYAQPVGGILWRKVLEPDPAENPLGLFVHRGRMDILGEVTVRGTLVARGQSNGDVHLHGSRVHFRPHDLPPLEGSDRPVRLPTLVLEDDLRIHPDTRGSIEGLVVVSDEFEVRWDWQADIDIPVRGHLVAGAVRIRHRLGWRLWRGLWDRWYRAFLAQQEAGIPHFPRWLAETAGLDPNPRIRVAAEEASIRYHWKHAEDPIYVPHPDDPGLRWDLVDWREYP